MSFFKKLFSPSNENPVMDWRGFTEYFTQAVESRLSCRAEIEWGEDLEDTTVHLHLPNGLAAQVYLGNRYAHYRQNPDSLDEIIEETVESAAQIGHPEATLARENIIPTIKSAAYADEIRRLYQEGGREEQMAELYFRPVAGDMVVVYMVDTGPSYRTLSRSEWADLQIADENELHELAVDNLRNYLNQEQNLGYRNSDNGLYQIYLNDVLDASLILLLEPIIDAAELNFAPYPVFAVPSRSMLLVCAADNQAALAQMQEIVADEIEESGYAVSPLLYCLKNGQISLFNAH